MTSSTMPYTLGPQYHNIACTIYILEVKVYNHEEKTDLMTTYGVVHNRIHIHILKSCYVNSNDSSCSNATIQFWVVSSYLGVGSLEICLRFIWEKSLDVLA